MPDEWHPLIGSTVASRPDPWRRVHEAADRELARRTADFVAWATAAVALAAGAEAGPVPD